MIILHASTFPFADQPPPPSITSGAHVARQEIINTIAERLARNRAAVDAADTKPARTIAYAAAAAAGDGPGAADVSAPVEVEAPAPAAGRGPRRRGAKRANDGDDDD